MNFAQCRMAGRGWRKTVSWVLVVVMLLALSALTGCGSQSAGTGLDAGVVELKLAHFWPSTHPVKLADTALANEINQVSNGKVRITTTPVGLVKANDIYDEVIKGSGYCVSVLHIRGRSGSGSV